MNRRERSAAGPRRARICVFCALLLAGSARFAAASSFDELRWRLVGPFRGGWVTAVAGVPGELAIGYIGTADGGVWKTENAGVTWRPLFNDQGSASIGALAIAASDRQVIWAGTGHAQQRWDVVDGDGVYRSTDGGESWRHVGLADSKNIGSIWVDSRDARVAVVAALGHIFGANAERGLFRTEDGGESWSHVLDRGPDVGAVDIAADPAHPERLYAALWQLRRHPWLDYFQPPVGTGSAIVRSTDGGKSWTSAGTAGMPPPPLGRIELGVSPGADGRTVFAAIHSASAGGSGLWRSSDGGDTWEKVNGDGALASSYMSGIIPDPRDPQVLWTLSQSLRRSTDGGKTFGVVKSGPGGDDYHAVWIDPVDSRHMIVGADQGGIVTLDGGATWSSWYNQPTGQFYRLSADDRFPYRIYSGQQDSGTVSIASRSDYGQITFRDWHPVGADERDGDIVDPVDPDIVYGAGLGGRITRWNARTGQSQNVTPWPVASYGNRPGTSRYRYDWITPLAIAKQPPHALYTGAQLLFRSTDGGQSWQPASPDLTGAVSGERNCDGDLPVERATACGWGAIFAIAPSPSAKPDAAGLIWVGTTNGRVQLTRDGGRSWNDVTPPALGDWSKVNTLDPSPSDPGTLYVAADRHRLDDSRPIAFRTHDFGATWTEIGHGLPDGAWVGVVRQDPEVAGLLFAGTSRGVHVSFDDGATWESLQNGLPTTGINDLMVKEDDLVVATQGRAIWALDQIAPLRDRARRTRAGTVDEDDLVLVPPAAAHRLRFNQNKDTPLPPEEPTGDNPPAGAVFDYLLPATHEGAVALEIVEAGGAVVRRFASDAPPEEISARVYFTERYLGPKVALGTTPGHHRFVWNLRRERPRALSYSYSIAAVAGRATEALPDGAFVVPGNYRVRLTAGGKSVEQALEVLPDPRVAATPAELAELARFQGEVERALGRATDLAVERRSLDKRLNDLAKEPTARKLRKEIDEVLAAMPAAVVANAAGDVDAAGWSGRLAALATDLDAVDAPPTGPQRALLTEAGPALDREATIWKRYLEKSVRPLERRLRHLGL